MKTAIVTGGNGGIGQQLVEALANADHRVVMACRNMEESNCICSQIKEKTGNNAIEVMNLDLASFSSIRQFVQDFRTRYKNADILLNNAAALCHHPKQTAEGVEYTVGVNYLGSYLLTELLHPQMNRGAKIINTVSLLLHYGKINDHFFQFNPAYFNRFIHYSNSKLALYYATLDWAEKWKEENITVNCVDPGIVNTKMIGMGTKIIDKLCDVLWRPLVRTPKQGADTINYLLLEEKNNTTGQLFKNRKIKSVSSSLQKHKQRERLKKQTEDFLTAYSCLL
ncbi:MAG: SDR family NAD(P)-dependent oxidoreductase [Bacteroidales bacterium]|jgi:NAD(P)-dependent dehydrogenase (short-subunit alcohol dehydrogenase family)|nr:SDR family NAD(P)-dependent oxidoreductase [Bacteroidales bacterium]